MAKDGGGLIGLRDLFDRNVEAKIPGDLDQALGIIDDKKRRPIIPFGSPRL